MNSWFVVIAVTGPDIRHGHRTLHQLITWLAQICSPLWYYPLNHCLLPSMYLFFLYLHDLYFFFFFSLSHCLWTFVVSRHGACTCWDPNPIQNPIQNTPTFFNKVLKFLFKIRKKKEQKKNFYIKQFSSSSMKPNQHITILHVMKNNVVDKMNSHQRNWSVFNPW